MPRLPATHKRVVHQEVKLHIGSGTSTELSNTVTKEVDKLAPKLYNETVKVLQETGQSSLSDAQKSDIVNKVVKSSTGQSGGLAPLLIGLLTAAAYKAVDTLIPLAADFVRSKVIKGKGVKLSGEGIALSGGAMTSESLTPIYYGDGIALSGVSSLKVSKSRKPARVMRGDTVRQSGAGDPKKKQIQIMPISENQPIMSVSSYAI
jgi:hypothetical protein